MNKCEYSCCYPETIFYYGVTTLAHLRHLPSAWAAISALLLSIMPAVTLFHTSAMV